MEVKAFPGAPTFDQDANRTVWQEGMDLRDWFAGMAMQTLLQRQDDTFMEIDYKVSSDEAIKQLNKLLCEDAYEIADAMMEARNGNTE